MTMVSFVVKASSLAILTATAVLTFLFGVRGDAPSDLTAYQRRVLGPGMGPRLVFVGGSNLAFGLDSEAVERETGLPTLNFGHNAHLGMALMLEEVIPALEPGDTIVTAFEYPLYYFDQHYVPWEEYGPFDGVNGAGPDLLSRIIERPSSRAAVTTWEQVAAMASAVPLAAQEKAMRLLNESALRLAGTAPPKPLFVTLLEGPDGSNQWGDIVAHRHLAASFVVEDTPAPDRSINVKAVAFLLRTSSRLRERGIRLVLLPPPRAETIYERERTDLDRLAAVLTRDLPAEAGMFRPESYVYPDSCFFDSENHLTWECRSLRTAQILGALRTLGIGE